MTTTELTPTELRERGYAALLRELGPIGFIRFMQQFESGGGDYTRDRQQWLGQLTPDEINRLIDLQRRPDSSRSG